MLHKKMLAYERGEDNETKKPERMKRLAFALSLVFPLFVSYDVPAAIRKELPPINTNVSTAQQQAPVITSCRAAANGIEYQLSDGTVKRAHILQRGEKITEITCKRNKVFVLTNTSLLIIEDGERQRTDDGIALSFQYSRTDMRDMLRRGLVAWTQGDDTCFFLTRDRMLTLIPVHEMNDTVPTYQIPFRAENAKMIYHSGFLFIASSGNMNVMNYDQTESRTLSIQPNIQNAEFFVLDGKLFFGRKEEKIEIRRNGQSVNDITLVHQ